MKHTTIAHMSPEDHLEMEDIEVTSRWHRTNSSPFVRKFDFSLSGDRWRQNFCVRFIAHPANYAPYNAFPGDGFRMDTQPILDLGNSRDDWIYGTLQNHVYMSWKGAMYRTHYVVEFKETVILDLRPPTPESIELFTLQRHFSAVCPP